MSRPLIMDADDDGMAVRSWIWECSNPECKNKAVAREGQAPPHWELDEEEDIETCKALCLDCVDDEVTLDDL